MLLKPLELNNIESFDDFDINFRFLSQIQIERPCFESME